MDEFKEIILEALDLPSTAWNDFVPSREMEKEQWQEAVRQIEAIIREDFENADFELTTGAVRSCYNRPLDDLAQIVEHQLKLDVSNDVVIAL